MSDLEDRIEALERADVDHRQEHDEGRRDHKAIAETMLQIHDQVNVLSGEVTNLSAHLTANGGLSVVVKDRRVKLTASWPTPWLWSLIPFGGGAVGVTKFFGLW